MALPSLPPLPPLSLPTLSEIRGVQVAHPWVLALAIPVVALMALLVARDFIRFKSRKEQAEYRRRKRLARIALFSTRCAIALLLLAAIAYPFSLVSESAPGDPTVTLLVDGSTSMEVFDVQVEQMRDALSQGGIPVTIKSIGQENTSALGDSILYNIKGDDNVLLVSDGNAHLGRGLGDVMLLAASINTTINAVRLKPARQDTAVSIEGPSEVTADTEEQYTVKVRQSIPASVAITVKADDAVILSESATGNRDIRISRALPEGYHILSAEVGGEDYFPENNLFRKTVKAYPKPAVLFVTKKASPAEPIFAGSYKLTTSSLIPENFDTFSAVVLNDISAREVKNVDTLSAYLKEGNGLFVMGGKGSFERGGYNGSRLEALLPVMVGKGTEEESAKANIVIVVDVSASTSTSYNEVLGFTVRDVEKALAINIINSTKDARIGVITFDTLVRRTWPMVERSDREKKTLFSDLAAVGRGGGTFIYVGLREAGSWLATAGSNKYVILISDGNDNTFPDSALDEARLLGRDGVKLYTVGVGPQTNEAFLQTLAASGKGAYFAHTQLEQLNLIFKRDKKEEKTQFDLVVVNSYDFITRELELKASVTGFNSVVPKATANLLVSTSENDPVLATWRFGLGRVAVLSTDDGSAWAGKLLGGNNSRLLVKGVNWAVGDLGRRLDYNVETKDSFLGEPAAITVRSKSKPAAEGLSFAKVSEGSYSASFTAGNPGVYSFLGSLVAVNYNRELREVGMNPKLEALISATNGEMFEEVTSEIVNKVKKDSVRVKVRRKGYSGLLVSAAILVFLAEIMGRRLAEARAQGRK